MSKKKTQGYKKKKQWALVRLVLCIVLALSCLLMGQVILSLLIAVLAFVINEVFFADHNFYNPSNDYQYSFEHAKNIKAEWQGNALMPSWAADSYDTGLLEIKVQHGFMGKWLDPFVTISSGTLTRKQYFERSVGGKRYINISDFIDANEAVTFTASHCELALESSDVLLFSNASLNDQKVLVIAPHADDAEIAAFGLYSENDSTIVTITAGEIGAENYESAYTNSEQASLLKGRLRAWDSIVVPQWAGLKSDAVIQLGYFCMRLQAMHDSPDEVIGSKTAGVQDTRVFREFNTQALQSDQHGKSTWNALVADLVECIDRINPDVIITPHMALDPHSDHYYSTLALKQALQQSANKPSDIYFYANHLETSDMFPFGPVHTLASLPPNTSRLAELGGVVSITLTMEQQKNKAASLAMMHDLQTPLRWKKRLRFKLQSWLIGRALSPYGDDEFFRKAIRSNEVFYRQAVDEFILKTPVEET